MSSYRQAVLSELGALPCLHKQIVSIYPCINSLQFDINEFSSCNSLHQRKLYAGLITAEPHPWLKKQHRSWHGVLVNGNWKRQSSGADARLAYKQVALNILQGSHSVSSQALAKSEVGQNCFFHVGDYQSPDTGLPKQLRDCMLLMHPLADP